MSSRNVVFNNTPLHGLQRERERERERESERERERERERKREREIQGTPQMAVDKEARAYRESTHIVIISVLLPLY